MKIIGLEAFHLRVRFVVPYKLSKLYGTVTHSDAVVIRVRTDDGLVGFGEANPHPQFNGETASGLLALFRDTLGPALLGLEAGSPAAVDAAMDAVLAGNLGAKGAVAMAACDLAGKARGVPVHALLGGALHRTLPVLWPLGNGTAEEDAAVIDAKRAEGYTSFMVKMGVNPVADDIRRLSALTERYGDAVTLIPDANQGWTVAEALRFAAGVAELGLPLLEQPVAKGNLAGLKRVRDAAGPPVSADESLTDLTSAWTLAQDGVVDAFSLKVAKNGGPLRTAKIAAVAEAAGIGILMNSMLELGITQAASLQLGCTLPHLLPVGHAYMSTLRFLDDVTDFSGFVKDGVVHVPDRPGLGIAVDEAALQRLSVGQIRVE